MLIVLFGWISHKQYTVDEVDYSEYLGPTWKQDLRDEPDTMYVSNHIGALLDIPAFATSPLIPAFMPAANLKSIPLMGYICEALQCIWMDRGAPKD